MGDRVKLLMTSIGSLVGQNVLDVLDWPGFSRRHLVTIVGTNSLADSPNNFRADRCHLVPETATSGFSDAITRIIADEEPDLILCGRDVDTHALSELLDDTAHRPRLPYGSTESLLAGLDKCETWRFCERNDLPFAATFVPGLSGDRDELRGFLEAVGYPVIVKPRQGFAALGVSFVRDWEQATRAFDDPGVLFQEYLGDRDRLAAFFRSVDQRTPLFLHAPETVHNTAQTTISPSGSIDQIFISYNTQRSGTTLGFERVRDDELDDIVRRFVSAYHGEGGHGPMGIQFRPDREGRPKVQEINLRTNGNTFPRMLMGQDDLAEILAYVAPDAAFPTYEPTTVETAMVFRKSLRAEGIPRSALEELEANLVWAAPTR